MDPGSETVLVIGVGNVLLGDEGLGVHVARRLLAERDPLPPRVTVLEAGTCLLDFIPQLPRYSHVIIVDAVRAGRPPGTIYRIELAAGFDGQFQASPPLSLHQWGVMETLWVAKCLGVLPQRLTLVGAEPERIAPGTELSSNLTQAAQRIVSMLRDELLSGTRTCPAQGPALRRGSIA